MQVLTVMREVAEEFPRETLSIIRLYVHRLGNSPSHDLISPLPYAIHSLLTATRFADALVSKRMLAAKLACLTSKRRERQKKIMRHGSEAIVEAQHLFVELIFMLDGIFEAGRPYD